MLTVGLEEGLQREPLEAHRDVQHKLTFLRFSLDLEKEAAGGLCGVDRDFFFFF